MEVVLIFHSIVSEIYLTKIKTNDLTFSFIGKSNNTVSSPISSPILQTKANAAEPIHLNATTEHIPQISISAPKNVSNNNKPIEIRSRNNHSQEEVPNEPDTKVARIKQYFLDMHIRWNAIVTHPTAIILIESIFLQPAYLTFFTVLTTYALGFLHFNYFWCIFIAFGANYAASTIISRIVDSTIRKERLHGTSHRKEVKKFYQKILYKSKISKKYLFFFLFHRCILIKNLLYGLIILLLLL